MAACPSRGEPGNAAQINEWCSPFKGFDQRAQAYVGHEVHWLDRNRTDSRLTFVPATVDGNRVLTLQLDDVDALMALMIETRTGSATAASLPEFEILCLGVSADKLPDFVRFAITGQPEMWRWDAHASYLRAKGLIELPQPPALLTAEDFINETPMARSRSWSVRVQNGEVPIVCVIGNTAEDHALALLCDRVFHHGAWIPTAFLHQETPAGMAALTGLRGLRHLPGGSHRPVLVTSTSESLDEVKRILDPINDLFTIHNIDGTPVSPGPEFVAVAPEELASETYQCFLADPTAFNVLQTVPAREGPGEVSVLTQMQFPYPEIADQVEDARWCIDVTVARYSAPPRTGLASRVFLQDAVGSIPDAVTRAGRDGVAFGSANVGFIHSGTPREGRLAHPLLRFPAAEQIFAELASVQSATVRRSDAGRRAAIAVEMWGSLEAIQADLRGPVRQLLNGFLSPPATHRFVRNRLRSPQRWLPYASTRCGRPQRDRGRGTARSTLDRLITAKVLRRGLILNCGRCRWQAFYRIEELGPSTFPCMACGSVSELTKETWANNEAEPVWHYSLDQVVRELLRQHGDVPLLAVDQLTTGRRSVLWSPELIVSKGNGTVELDIAIIIDGKIVLGEAKSNGTLGPGGKSPKNAAERLVATAQTLSADEIVLATSTPTWTPGTRAAIDAAVAAKWTRGPKPKITELTGIGST
jgi:hypothetical protein